MTFDPVLIGEHIKQLLKTHNMTQDQLANHLHITKSAVSQNLNGKSSFDIQNLIAISTLFNISLDDLLGLKNQEKRLPSAYELLLEKGLEGINHVPPKQLQLDKPDIYGKLYIEYVLQDNNMVIFNYIRTHNIPFVDPNYQRASEVTLKVLLYMMEYKLDGVQTIFDDYIKLKDGIHFDDPMSEALFYGLLESDAHDALREYFVKTLVDDFKISILKSKPKRLKVSIESLVDVVTTHKLHKLFILLLGHLDLEPHFFYTVKSAIGNKDHDTLTLLLENTFNTLPNSFKMSMYNLEEATKLMFSTKDDVLIKQALDKHLYQDITVLFNYAIELELFSMVSYMWLKFEKLLQPKKIKFSPLMKDLSLLDNIFDTLKQDDKDYILTKSKSTELAFMLYAFKKGARFKFEHVDNQSFKSLNALIETLTQGDHS